MGVSPWLDDLQDDPDNYIILSPGGAIVHENPNSDFAFNEGTPPPEWTLKVFRSGPSRVGYYAAYEVLGGESPETAVGCCLAHADFGDTDSQSWNHSTVGPENDGDPACRALPTAGVLTEPSADSDEVYFSSGVHGTPGDPLLGAYADAVVGGPSYFLWYLPVRDNMPPRGALDFIPQPEDYGYPPFSEGTEIEWEYDYPELVGIEMADGDPVEDALLEGYNLETKWAINDGLAPVHSSAPGDPHRAWKKGFYPDNGDPSWMYYEGDPEWYELPDSAGWGGHGWVEDYEYVPDVSPLASDGVAAAWPTVTDGSGARLARIAVKFVLQARRFRFITPGGGVPPRRFVGRPDHLAGGAQRWAPHPKSVQGGRRWGGAVI